LLPRGAESPGCDANAFVIFFVDDGDFIIVVVDVDEMRRPAGAVSELPPAPSISAARGEAEVKDGIFLL